MSVIRSSSVITTSAGMVQQSPDCLHFQLASTGLGWGSMGRKEVAMKCNDYTFYGVRSRRNRVKSVVKSAPGLTL